MLNDKTAYPNIAVKDIAVARKFYENTLGFKKVDDEGDELVAYETGPTRFIVYQSDYAGTNKATAMTWVVGDDLEDTVEELKSKGVEFEHYDMLGLHLEGDIHVGDDMKVAWFKDPDGNILNIVSG
jgi:catechol 2,3-dioxygenase-like lactoylglutathione lyase family enzyme